MKYIIFEDFSGQSIPFIFPEKVDHADMREQMPYTKVLSLGYVILAGGEFVCSGGDAAMGISSHEGDADCIASFFVRRSM